MKLTILGNNSAIPAHGRHPTAQIIEHQQKLYLIDCGEGTQTRLQDYKIKRSRIKAIFISHLHGDHYFGLIGLLSSFNLTNREQPLHIYAPPELKKVIQLQMEIVDAVFVFPIHFHDILENTNATLFEDEHIKISCFPVEHRIPTHGFRFETAPGLRKINVLQCERHEVPVLFYKNLQKGEDYINDSGKRIPNTDLTTEGTPAKTYVFAADTRVFDGLAERIGPCDLLYHESTYLDEDADKAFDRFHSTAKEAAAIALNAGAQQLMLGHFSSRYKDLTPFQEEASSIFTNTIISEEGITYDI